MLVQFASLLLTGFSCVVAFPVSIFCVEIFAAATVRRYSCCQSPAVNGDRRGRVAVLVPAHNESTYLSNTLHDIRAQIRSGDRIVVVADNCTDDTAGVAAAAGVEVTERHDQSKFGKGYALEWGLRYLERDPPDVVIMIDADCNLSEHAIYYLATACQETSRPNQALDLMTAPKGSAINYRVAEFAWRVKNWLRPLGLSVLGLPSQLMGTGMAFPWRIIASAKISSDSLVEDLQLGLDLARDGHPPLFCPSACVTSEFPTSSAGAAVQRERWEHGHIGMIVTRTPFLLLQSLSSRSLDLFALTLDLGVPPLTLLGMLVIAALGLSTVGVLLGASSAAVIIAIASILGYSAALFLCWLRVGRDILPLGAIGAIGSYALSKLTIYCHIFFRGGDPRWVRTERKGAEKDEAMLPPDRHPL